MDSLSIQQSIRKFCHLFEPHHDESKQLTGSSLPRKSLEHNFWQQLLHKDRPVSPSADLEQRLESAGLDIFLRQEGYGDAEAEGMLEEFHKNAALLCATEDGLNIVEFLLALQDCGSDEKRHRIPSRTKRKHGHGIFEQLLAENCEQTNISPNPFRELSAACQDLFKSAARKKRDIVPTNEIFNPSIAIERNFEEPLTTETIPRDADRRSDKRNFSQEKAEIGRWSLPKTLVGNLLASSALNDFHIAVTAVNYCGSRLTTKSFQSELTKVAIGIPSVSFDFDESNGYRLKESVGVVGLDQRIVEDFTNCVAVTGNAVRHVRSFLQRPAEKKGLTLLRFTQACKMYLDGFMAVLSERCKASKDIVTFQQTVMSFTSPIKFLQEVCAEVGATKVGLDLLQFLYEKCLDMVGNQTLLPIALFLLEESAVPFFDMVTGLALRGHVASVLVFAEEFGVLINEHVLNRAKISFWDDAFFTNDIPTTFLTEFLLKAVEAARCLLLLKAVRPYHPLLPSHNTTKQPSLPDFRLCFTEDSQSYLASFQQYGQEMSQKLDLVSQKELKQKTLKQTPEVGADFGSSFGSIFRSEDKAKSEDDRKPEEVFEKNWKNHHGSLKAVMHRNILPVIDIQVGLAEKAVVKLFFDTMRISDHINVIRNYFFLENGEFAATFSANLFEKASRASLKSCLEVSSLLFCFDMSLSDQVRRDKKVNKRLTLLSTRPSDVPAATSSFDLTDFLGLEYKIDWPLNMILTPDLMLKCNAVFRRLLRIKGCVWTLNDTFVLLNEAQDVQNESNRSFLSVVRHEMAHVIRVLDVHFMDVAVHRSWRESQAALEGEVSSFEELRNAVRLYVTNVHGKCIVEDTQGSRFAWVLSEILRYTMRFYAELKAEASIEDLRKTYAIFQQCVHFILENAEKRRGVPVDFDCETFLSRLDFSEYYRNYKNAPTTERSPGKNRSRSILRSLYGTL